MNEENVYIVRLADDQRDIVIEIEHKDEHVFWWDPIYIEEVIDNNGNVGIAFAPVIRFSNQRWIEAPQRHHVVYVMRPTQHILEARKKWLEVYNEYLRKMTEAQQEKIQVDPTGRILNFNIEKKE